MCDFVSSYDFDFAFAFFVHCELACMQQMMEISPRADVVLNVNGTSAGRLRSFYRLDFLK